MSGKIYTGTNFSIPFNKNGVIKDFEIEGNSWQETRSGKNKFNKNTITANYRLGSSGDLFSDAYYFASDFIEVSPSTTYSLTNNKKGGDECVCEYDADKNFIRRNRDYPEIPYTFITQSETKFVRIADYNENIDYLQFEEGPATDYELYGAMPSPEFRSEIRNVGENVNKFYLQTMPDNTWISMNESQLIKIKQGTGPTPTPIPLDIKLNIGDTITTSIYCLKGKYTNNPNNTSEVSLGLYHNGTSTAWQGQIKLPRGESLKNKTYSTTTTITNEVNAFMPFIYGSPIIEEDIEFYVKVEKGSKATPYSPYNCGNANITVCNGNFFNVSDVVATENASIEKTEDGFIATRTSPSSSDTFVASYEKQLKPNTKYTFYEKKSATTTCYFYNDKLWGTTLNRETIESSSDLLIYTFTTDSTGKVVIGFYSVNQTQGDTFTLSNIMILEGTYKQDTIPEYVKGESQQFTFPLSEGQRMYKDSYLADDGVHHKRNTLILTGTENWKGTTDFYTSILASSISDCLASTEILGLSNTFLVNGYNYRKDNNLYFHTNKNLMIRNPENKYYATLDEWKSYLAEQYANGTPVIVEYELAEEIIEPYTEEQKLALFELPANAPITYYSTLGETPAILTINSANLIPEETPQMQALTETVSNEQTRISLELWSHKDEFIDTLYSVDYEFEGQCIDPKMTLNANGSKTLTLSLPLYIIDRKTQEFIENPRWNYIIHQYKIRVKQDDRINEFVLRDYTETHDANDQLMVNINAQSLEEFELSQTGYNITFDENTLYKFNENEDPNDPDTVPIGTYDADIHFWNSKLLENSDWDYRVESYYPIDKEMEQDNRQITNPNLDYKNGKEQFYEEDRIIDYTEDNEPIYAEEYEVKKRVVKASKSNIFNIVQDLCEAFECWPTFEIQYENEKIVKKTIVYKNDIPQDAKFSINYQTNLNSIERVVDSSQIVTKMYVTPVTNENVDNGIITISTNPKNYMKESYLLDLSWYLGEDRLETDIPNAQLIDPNIGMHFVGTNYSEPLFTTIDTTNTKDTISTYEKNIRSRNTYIENMSLQLSKHQEELINLKTEREYVQSQRDAIQETVNGLIDEMSLIGYTGLRKENKACYLYKQNNIVVIRFSEIGIKDVPSAETFNTPINLITLDGRPYYEEGKVPNGVEDGEWVNIKELKLVPYKVDPIIGTILECQVVNATIGTSEDSDYASFKCSFDYDPYEYYKKLIAYWRAKITAAENRLVVLGKSREDGGNEGLIYDLEGQIINEKKYVYQAQKQKAEVIKEFESQMAPYIREGYWENTDFGIYMNKQQSSEYIPDEFKVLKYGQTEDSTSEETDKYDWSKDYVSYLIPNVAVSANGKSTYLYNIIDIEEIEVMNDNPINANDNFRTYVKGTDYTIEYGYTSETPGITASNRGIYIRFYEPEVNTSNDYIPQFTMDTQVYIRIKPRGSTQYVWTGYQKPTSFTSNGEKKRCWYCPLEQRITINDKDIILSSIVVKADTQKINYDVNGNMIIEDTLYELKYGKDYYTSKEIENGVTVSRVTFYQTTNAPLMDFQYAKYIVEYNQDITAKYYYNDALDVMKESSIPQTTYNVNVLDISEAENFLTNLKWYKPQVGTRVPIYDEELRFRGLVGFINSVTFDLLNPQNTQLSITNFKDKFVDLFQKITASTIALQSKEYEYDRSTQIITVEGGINTEVLKDTFERPDSNFSVTPNSNIVWDYTGITSTSDKLNENGVYAQVRVTPNGIFTANQKDEFGNYIWTTAITPTGINASQLTIGKLDTRQIQIFNSSEPRFLWNENGLYAYGQNQGKTDFETYVLYNENGIKFRQLMQSNKKVILPNLVNAPTFADTSYWQYSSTDNDVFNTESTGVIEEVEIVNTTPISVYQVAVGDKSTGNITFNLKSTKKDLVRDHQYYFRIYVKTNNIPELANIDISAGFAGFYKNIQYSQNNQYVKIDGFVTGVLNENNFGVNVVLPSSVPNWSIFVKHPMILDVTEIFGNTIPSLQWFSDLADIEEEGTWETTLDVYGDALKLDWGGLTIGAQDNSLQLTSQDGLVIYHPITTETNNEKRMRLQLGQWTEPAKDEFGNIITNGSEIVYEEMYGLRALDLDGNMIFKVSQRGVEFDFTDNLEETIKNYAGSAAIDAIASTNTSNLLKNSCGYIYEEQKDPATGNPTGLYEFFDWEVENTNYLFPVNERYTQKNNVGNEVSVVDGTVSKHAFMMGGDTATEARPVITQTVDVATNEGTIQPFTLKFLMKGISNTQTSTIKNGIHLEIFEAGNQEDISVDIPYTRTDGEWQQVKYTIFTEMRQLTVTLKNISTITVDDNNLPTNGVIYLSDLMLTSGKDTPAWTVSPGEVYNNYVTIGSEGVVVTSERDTAGAIVRTVMDSHSFRVETISSKNEVSTNILVDEDNTTLGPTHIKGKCDIGAITRLRFIENTDLDLAVEERDSGVDITLIKG